MDINRGNLESIFRNVVTAWQRGLDNAPDAAFLKEICTEVPSTSSSVLYAWLLKTTGWREMDPQTGRSYQDVETADFEVANVEFEDTVRMLRKDIEDDNVGVYSPLIEEMAQGWVSYKCRRILWTLIDNAKCWVKSSGAYTNIIADTHAYGANNVDNLVTTSLAASAIQTAKTTMAGWKFPNGDPTYSRPTVLLCGETLRATAEQILERQHMVDSGTVGSVENLLYKSLKLFVRPEINATAGKASNVTATYYWFLLDCSRPVKPLCWQNRRAPEILADLDPATVKRTGFVDFLGDARGAACPTHPHLVYGAQATS